MLLPRPILLLLASLLLVPQLHAQSVDDLLDRLRHVHDSVERSPRAAGPRFSRALLKLELHRRGAISKAGLGGQQSGESWYHGFERDVVDAFARDSLHPPAVEFLPRFLARQGDRTQPDGFLEAMLRVARLPGARPDAALVAGRLLRQRGRHAEALGAFERYATLGGSRGVALLERARGLEATGERTAARATYLAGAAATDSAGVAAYRNDLAWILDSAELASFDALEPARRPEWIEGLFQLRDAEAIRLPGERLSEHLRRWNAVHAQFRIEHPQRWSGFVNVHVPPPAPCTRSAPDGIDPATLAFDPSRRDDDRREEGVLDHRAIVYMRHGAPAMVQLGRHLLADSAIAPLVPAGTARPDTEVLLWAQMDPDLSARSDVWVYWFSGRTRVFTFVPGILNSEQGPRVLSLSPPASASLLWSLGRADPVMRRAAARLATYENRLGSGAVPLACLPSMQDLAIRSEQDVVDAANSDSHSLIFGVPLNPVLQVAAVGVPASGTGRLLVVFAVPGATLRPVVAAPGDVRYTLRLRLTAVDRDHGTVRTHDTLRTWVMDAPLAGRQHLSGLFEVPLAAGRHEVRLAVMDTDGFSGGQQLWEAVRVGASRGTLALSDIVLAAESGGLRWENLGHPVEVNALNAYPSGGVAPVYYEASGLVPGRRYRTTLTVVPEGETTERGVTVTFLEEAPDRLTRYRRTIGLERLTRGRHALTVAIEDMETGARDERERTIHIVDP